ncbi:hypothetical protein JCM33374_g1585 [Metschnikowia sp. JCM 33374]|nr:hypothetical protein JCM33374_g1585 [Metschnikowia sp. JCM 33374]
MCGSWLSSGPSRARNPRFSIFPPTANLTLSANGPPGFSNWLTVEPLPGPRRSPTQDVMSSCPGVHFSAQRGTPTVFGVSGYSGAGTKPSKKNDINHLNTNLIR